MKIDELLSESVEAATVREREAFKSIAGQKSKRIVLFGAGTLGRKIARALKADGVVPLAFADNNPGLVGTEVEGVRVFDLADACGRWGNNAVFVVTIFHPTIDGGMQSRLDALVALGCQTATTFLPLAWGSKNVLPHYGGDLPSRILVHAGSLMEIAESLTDSVSREIFRKELAWRLWGDFSEAGPPVPRQYFPRDLILPFEDEIFVDGGAFDGDTLRAIPWKMKRAWAIEPDPGNLARLAGYRDKGVRICNVALGREADRVAFNAEGTMASAISKSGAIEVEVATLDELLKDELPTFLKLDIEGAELAALEGARMILQKAKPLVAVCLYHRSEDLWVIPLFLKEILPQHKLSVRVHARDGFELVFYAIPPGRFSNHG